MQTSGKDWWRRFKLLPRDIQLYWAALAVVLALGVFLRLNGYVGQSSSLWLDEALWAKRFVRWPLLSFGIRPLGFVWLTRVLVNTFGATELWFRFLPCLGAVASLLLMPYVATRLLTSRLVQLLLVLLVAIHPALVDFAKEFKPYSLEVLVHLLPIVLYLRYEQTGKVRWLHALLAYLPVSFLFAYNIAFALPGLLLLALRSAWLSDHRRRLVLATLLSGALSVAVIGVTYRLALSKIASEDRTENYWGKKYHVFYRPTPDEEQSRVDWTLQKAGDLATMVGMRRQLWSDPGRLPARFAAELGSLDRWLWIVLYISGLAALWRRQRQRLLLLFAPVVVLAIVNALGRWPFGAFRTNLFMSVYLVPLPLLGLELLSGGSVQRRRALLLAVSLTCIVPGFLFGFDWHGHKRTWTRDHHQREVIERLYALRREQLQQQPDAPRARLILDLHTHESHEYYLTTHPEFMQKYGDFFQRNFIVDEVGSGAVVRKLQQRLRRAEPVYVVASKDMAAQALDEFSSRAKVLKREQVKDEHLILLVTKD